MRKINTIAGVLLLVLGLAQGAQAQEPGSEKAGWVGGMLGRFGFGIDVSLPISVLNIDMAAFGDGLVFASRQSYIVGARYPASPTTEPSFQVTVGGGAIRCQRPIDTSSCSVGTEFVAAAYLGPRLILPISTGSAMFVEAGYIAALGSRTERMSLSTYRASAGFAFRLY